MNDASRWDIPVGKVLPRTEVHRLYGGVQQGGISPSRTSPNVHLFFDPRSARKHGYFVDRWQGELFLYCGEGQVGDQSMRRFNLAIRDHITAGRSLRLFQGTRGSVKYLGEFSLDADHPWNWDTADDLTGAGRRVIVFRLAPKYVAESRSTLEDRSVGSDTDSPAPTFPDPIETNKYGPKLKPTQRADLPNAVLRGMTTRSAAAKYGVTHSSARWLVNQEAWVEVRRMLGWEPQMSIERILRLGHSQNVGTTTALDQIGRSAVGRSAVEARPADGRLVAQLQARVATLESGLAQLRLELAELGATDDKARHRGQP